MKPRSSCRCTGTSSSCPSWSPRRWSPRRAGPTRARTAGLRRFADAGFDEVYVSQVGGAPDAFFEFYAGQVLPRARGN